jgi:hypothetical protein
MRRSSHHLIGSHGLTGFSWSIKAESLNTKARIENNHKHHAVPSQPLLPKQVEISLKQAQ